MQTATEKRSRRRKYVGNVIKTKMNKTITVEIMRLVKHPKYGKYVKKSTVYKVHDEEKSAKVGDKVEIAECRPISKTKFTRFVRIVEKAKD
ncbi:30S ribosomal protein S17 [Candidatus Kuenenia sp.]|uniref:30S ribosomal protein S17 n=1 Tax=Candidatus Kuenenia sp. TaxID=2499824 RepID=UPI00321FD3D8